MVALILRWTHARRWRIFTIIGECVLFTCTLPRPLDRCMYVCVDAENLLIGGAGHCTCAMQDRLGRSQLSTPLELRYEHELVCGRAEGMLTENPCPKREL